MKFWKVKTSVFAGHKYEEVERHAKDFFSLLKSQTKRKTHVKSKFFKSKIFFDYFWKHLFQKPVSQRKRRLKLFVCAIELIENSTYQPETKTNPNKSSEKLHRFYGQAASGEKFVVQIKERITRSKVVKQLMSVFPWK